VRVQALRGATTCDEDTSEEIEAKTGALLRTIFDRNGLSNDDIVSVIFTSTPDLTSQFPATAARAAMDLGDVALLGAQEQAVADAVPRCVRVLVHCYTDRSRDALEHVFLGGAADLRRDLAR
jgi:chorismate mutase